MQKRLSGRSMKWLSAFLLSAISLSAKDFGKRAETFPIVEEDFISMIEKAVERFDFEGYMQEMADSFQNPKPLSYLTEGDQSRSFSLEAPEGLEEMELLFFDGSNEKQIQWAKSQEPGALWILVKGSPIALGEKEGREVFFDQFGIYTSRLNIEHIPAKAVVRGDRIVVEEAKL